MRAIRPASRRLAITAFAVVLCTSTTAAQQTDQQEAEIQSYRLPGWSFTPSVAFGAIYDTNIALTSSRTSTGGTQGDSLFHIVPAGQLEFTGKRTGFSAGYSGFLRRYMDVEGLDGFNQGVSIGFRHAWSRRLSVFATDSYVDSPTTDDVVEVTGVPFRRTGSKRNTFGAGSQFRITKFTAWSSRYDMTRVTFEQPDIFLIGGDIHALRNEVSHQLNARLQLGGEYTYRTAFLHDERTVGIQREDREFGFQDFGGVVRFAFGPHTTGSAASGYATLHDRNAGETRTGPYVRLSLTHELERVTAGVSFARQYVPTFGIGGSSSSEEIRGYLRLPVARNRVYTHLSGGWRRSIPFEVESLQLDTFVVRSVTGYSATRWARMEGVYTYTRQDSIVTGGEADRHRIGVQFVVSQPMRIR